MNYLLENLGLPCSQHSVQVQTLQAGTDLGQVEPEWDAEIVRINSE